MSLTSNIGLQLQLGLLLGWEVMACLRALLLLLLAGAPGFRGAAAVYTGLGGFQMRYQWDTGTVDPPACGEASLQEAAALRGVWVGQMASRMLLPGAVATQDLVLGVVDSRSLRWALTMLGFNITESEFATSTLPPATTYLLWLKQQVLAGFPVLVGMRLKGGTDPWYDHVSTLFGMQYNSPPTTYSGADVMHWSAHFPTSSMVPTTRAMNATNLFVPVGGCTYTAPQGGCFPAGIENYALVVRGLLGLPVAIRSPVLNITGWSNGVAYYKEPTAASGATALYTLNVAGCAAAGQAFSVYRFNGIQAFRPGTASWSGSGWSQTLVYTGTNPASLTALNTRCTAAGANCVKKSFTMAAAPAPLTQADMGAFPSNGVTYFVCAAEAAPPPPPPPAAPRCSVVIEPTAALASAVTLNLADVRLFDAGGVAINASEIAANLTTEFNNGTRVALCLDGSNSTFCATLPELAPRMTLAYNCSRGLSRVVVTNRLQACCKDAIGSFSMRFANASGARQYTDWTFAPGLDTFTIIPRPLLTNGTCTVVIEPRSPLPYPSTALYLNLAGVKLYGRGGAALAFNGPDASTSASATLSSVYNNASAYAVASCTDSLNTTFCATKNPPADPKPSLTLRWPCALAPLTRVVVVNRLDCCTSRIGNFVMRFRDGARATMASDYLFAPSLAAYSVVPLAV